MKVGGKEKVTATEASSSRVAYRYRDDLAHSALCFVSFIGYKEKGGLSFVR